MNNNEKNEDPLTVLGCSKGFTQEELMKDTDGIVITMTNGVELKIEPLDEGMINLNIITGGQFNHVQKTNLYIQK